MKAKTADEITRKEFLAYREVQEAGCYNMVMEARQAMASAGLDADTYWGIIQNYTELYKKFIQK